MTTNTIIDNGTDSAIGDGDAARLLAGKQIYRCPDCETLPDEHIYHVAAGLETDYANATGPFAFLR